MCPKLASSTVPYHIINFEFLRYLMKLSSNVVNLEWFIPDPAAAFRIQPDVFKACLAEKIFIIIIF